MTLAKGDMGGDRRKEVITGDTGSEWASIGTNNDRKTQGVLRRGCMCNLAQLLFGITFKI